jgi:hypothetical protein
MRRAIDFFEGDRVDEPVLKKLVRAAIDYSRSKSKTETAARPRAKARKTRR